MAEPVPPVPLDGDDPLRLDRMVCFPLYAASNLFTRLYRGVLAELGLTYPQYLVMLVLWEAVGTPRSVGELGQRLHLDSGTLTPLLKRLEQAGLVSRRRDSADERRVLVELTTEGRALRIKAAAVPATLVQALGLPPHEIEALRNAVQGVVALLSSRLDLDRSTQNADAATLPPPLLHRSGISMSESLYDIPLKQIDGKPSTLGAYKGKVLLVVNVASKCGLTPQYEGLEKLYQDKRGHGLEVLGFPANNFKGQEPGTDAEISDFCSVTYNVHFPLFSKISVLGDDQHPLYARLTRAQPASTGEGPFRERLASKGILTGGPADVLWNFEKFLIGRGGQVAARFSPDVTADDPRLTAAIDAELAKPGK